MAAQAPHSPESTINALSPKVLPEEQESQIRHILLQLQEIHTQENNPGMKQKPVQRLILSGLAEVLQLAESGEITTIIVPRLDRLRSTHLHQQVLQQLKESGVNLISIEEKMLRQPLPAGKWLLNIIGILSKWNHAEFLIELGN